MSQSQNTLNKNQCFAENVVTEDLTLIIITN